MDGIIFDVDGTITNTSVETQVALAQQNDIIVLASHNGNNYNSYFGNLKNIPIIVIIGNLLN